MVIVFVDLLGVKAKWHSGGVDAVDKAFKGYYRCLSVALTSVDPASVVTGGIESDSAAIVFHEPFPAIKFIQAFYLHSFNSSRTQGEDRIWLRGAILPYEGPPELRNSRPIKKLPKITFFEYPKQVLDAISVEKAGFKGMRFLVDSELLTESLRNSIKMPLGSGWFHPIRKLSNSVYPGRVNSGYHEYLWMASTTESTWSDRRRLMEKKLRWAAPDPEEFLHAAATQVVFHECEAILYTVRNQQA